MESATKNKSSQEIEAEFFHGKCSEAKYEILKHLIQDLIDSKDLNLEKLSEKYASQEKLAKFDKLDAQSKKFLEKLVLDVYLDLIVTKPDVFKGLLMLSLDADDKKLHGKIVKEISYPVVIDLIKVLKEKAPNVFNDEVEKPINSKLKEMLNLFNL